MVGPTDLEQTGKQRRLIFQFVCSVEVNNAFLRHGAICSRCVLKNRFQRATGTASAQAAQIASEVIGRMLSEPPAGSKQRLKTSGTKVCVVGKSPRDTQPTHNGKRDMVNDAGLPSIPIPEVGPSSLNIGGSRNYQCSVRTKLPHHLGHPCPIRFASNSVTTF